MTDHPPSTGNSTSMRIWSVDRTIDVDLANLVIIAAETREAHPPVSGVRSVPRPTAVRCKMPSRRVTSIDASSTPAVVTTSSHT